MEISGSSEIDIESFNLSLAKLGPFQDTEYTTGRADEGDSNRVVLYLARPGGEGWRNLQAIRDDAR